MAQDNGKVVQVQVPVRIDFAGGWSDVDDFASREGGAVFHAAVNQYVKGSASWNGWQLRLEYTLDLPADSHLGSSGAINIAYLALANALEDRVQTPQELAEAGYVLEGLLGTKGGKQDLYAAALGGFHFLRFHGDDNPIDVEQLDAPPDTIRALEERCIICHSGARSSSSDLHKQVWERYRNGDQEIAGLLRMLRDTAPRARDAFMRGDLDALAEEIRLNRETARQLHDEVVTPRMDELFNAGERAGALGSKGCGAGGGGCLVFVCAEGKRAAVEAALREVGGVIIPFAFAPVSDGSNLR